MQKTTLRSSLRHRRQQLYYAQQALAAQKLSQQLQQLPQLSTAQNIAIYYPSDGEISLLHFATQQPQHSFHLSSLSSEEQRLLIFHPWQPQEAIQYNHLHVAEPMEQKIAINALELDVILMPLVGFSKTGGRLGMGGGFYDYTLRNIDSASPRPYLVGVAHACQEVENLPVDDWDIAMDAVVTDKERFIFQRR